MDLDNLPPWDQIPYFLNPTLAQVSGSGFGTVLTKICSYDPQRVVLIFSIPNGGTPINIGPTPSLPDNTYGLLLNATFPRMEITQQIHGTLVNQEWWAFMSQSDHVNVITLSLKEWPNERTIVKSSPLRQPNRSNRRSRFNPIAPPE